MQFVCLLYIVIYTVNIITSPSGYPVDLNNNIFEYFTETDLSLTCSVIPSPPSNSKFIWGCSTGCFADMQMEQTINVTLSNVTDGGVLNCSVVINGVQYFSESFEVQVIDGKLCHLLKAAYNGKLTCAHIIVLYSSV